MANLSRVFLIKGNRVYTDCLYSELLMGIRRPIHIVDEIKVVDFHFCTGLNRVLPVIC